MTVPAKDVHKAVRLMGLAPATADLSYLQQGLPTTVAGTKRSFQEVGEAADTSEYDHSTTAPAPVRVQLMVDLLALTLIRE